MDIGLFVVLMIVVYVVPELLKRMKRKKPNQYPPIPIPIPPQGQDRPGAGIPGELARGIKPVFHSVYEMSGEGMAGDEGDPDWESKESLEVEDVSGPLAVGELTLRFDPAEAAQGVVWAEVLAPPLAMRSNRRSLGRVGHGAM